MDEKRIKDHLRALAQRSGLTLTNLREHPELWDALDLAGPEEVQRHIIDVLSKLDGTREGLALRRAYGLSAAESSSSLASRRSSLAKELAVSIDTVKRYERSGVDQLYLWLFPQTLPTVNDTRFETFTGPIEIDMSEPNLCTTLFTGDGIQLAVSRQQRPDAEPSVVYWFDESFIDSERQVWFFYIRPRPDMVESLLQFQLGGSHSSPVVVRFNVAPEPGGLRIGFQGPARPSQVVWGESPDPDNFTAETHIGLFRTGATNGTWLGLLHDGRPTVTTAVVLRDFVPEWKEEDLGPDLIRSGLLIPIFRTAGVT